MKRTSKSFILANIFDVITTIFGLSQGCVEMNIFVNRYGWVVGSAIKILAIMFVIYVLEKSRDWRGFWAPAIITWLVAVWNIILGIIQMVQ